MSATFTRDDYVSFCEGIRDLCAIDLLKYKRGQMERRVRAFAERNGHAGLGPYLEALSCDARVLDDFLDRVTINVSNLWRNPEQWDNLERTLVPELAANGSFNAWSAGCSYGAEAYTLAAICKMAAPRATARIKGTDIDRRAIDHARRGEFTAEDIRTAPPHALERFFVHDEPHWRPTDELRRLVSFEVADLLNMSFPSEVYDLVLCRNTVIYFNEDVRDLLHARLTGSLRDGGVLVVGSSERVSAPDTIGLKSIAHFTYRKA